jgi:xanthine dehydrogenase YagR molybdenum-binding subunit
MRDGRYLIGQGMAAAIYTHWRWPGKARVTINGDGSALVEAAAHDIGTGTYTVMAQVAADVLGLAPDKVSVRLGDTRLPSHTRPSDQPPSPTLLRRSCWQHGPHARRRSH